MIGPEPFIYPIGIEWRRAVVLFDLPEPSIVRAIDAESGRLLAETVQANDHGRLVLDGLVPSTRYVMDVQWDGGSRRLIIETLTEPQGPCLQSWAVLADPHLSLSNENRKGRLFAESGMLLDDVLGHACRLGCSFAVVPGDLTNAGADEEYAELKRILQRHPIDVLAAPGDHDLGNGSAHWRDTLGPTRRATCRDDLTVVCLDTHDGTLHDDDLHQLVDTAPTAGGLRLVVSHHQLVPDGFIDRGKSKAVRNTADIEKRLDDWAGRGRTLVYVGHQNVPSMVECGRVVQFNVPMIPQFACAWVLARRYADGVAHTVVPIRSDALQHASRLGCAQAARLYDEPQWQLDYRLGPDPYQLNRVVSID